MKIRAFRKLALEVALFVASAAAGAAVGLGGVAYLGYALTRHSVEEKVVPGGEVIFEHEDKETTRILNYIAGKEDLPREMKLDIVRKVFGRSLRGLGIEAQADIDEMDEAELEGLCLYLEWCLVLTEPNNEAFGPAFSNGSRKEWFDKIIMPLPAYDADLYKGLWGIELATGNPAIRWSDGTSWLLGSTTYYYPFANTIYLSPARFTYAGSVIDDFVDEAAHSKQFKDGPARSFLCSMRDNIVVLYYAAVRKKSFG